MSEQPVTPDPRIEAALEADKQYNTNGLCHFGVQCDDCNCFYQPERDDPRYRARMTFVLAAADAVDSVRAELARYQAAVQAAIRFVDQVAAGEHSFGPWPGMGDFFRAEMAQLIGSDAGWIAEHLGDER